MANSIQYIMASLVATSLFVCFSLAALAYDFSLENIQAGNKVREWTVVSVSDKPTPVNYSLEFSGTVMLTGTYKISDYWGGDAYVLTLDEKSLDKIPQLQGGPKTYGIVLDNLSAKDKKRLQASGIATIKTSKYIVVESAEDGIARVEVLKVVSAKPRK